MESHKKWKEVEVGRNRYCLPKVFPPNSPPSSLLALKHTSKETKKKFPSKNKREKERKEKEFLPFTQLTFILLLKPPEFRSKPSQKKRKKKREKD